MLTGRSFESGDRISIRIQAYGSKLDRLPKILEGVLCQGSQFANDGYGMPVSRSTADT
jgi:hypothetical protein